LLLGADVEGGLQVFDLSTNKLQSSMPKVAKTATQVMSY
jgi:methylamine dehydrogenase heavy chain